LPPPPSPTLAWEEEVRTGEMQLKGAIYAKSKNQQKKGMITGVFVRNNEKFLPVIMPKNIMDPPDKSV
jgi:hypothetical protein